jgi:hypothetical protein
LWQKLERTLNLRASKSPINTNQPFSGLTQEKKTVKSTFDRPTLTGLGSQAAYIHAFRMIFKSPFYIFKGTAA